MKEFEKIELLLKTKSYDELTKDERRLIETELSEEAYNELRLSITQLAGERLKVKKDVKHSLIAELHQVDKRPFAIFSFRLPAYTHLIPLAIICYLLFFLPETVVTKDRVVEVPIRDTVLISQTDTLWVERVVKVPTLVYVTREESSDKSQSKLDSEPMKQQTVNRSLSDQKDVIDLVVRGIE